MADTAHTSLSDVHTSLPEGGLRFRRMMTGKIHRATVTGADLNYVGSVTIDANLLEASDILPGQEVDIVDITNGSRLTTYTIPGPRGSGEITVNGAAAHLVKAGDLIIIISYSLFDDAAAHSYTPHVVFVDEKNQIVSTSTEPGQVPSGASAGGAPLKSSGVPFTAARGEQ